MFISVRTYRNAKSVEEIKRRVEQEFVPLMSTLPGFRGYYALDCGNNVLTSISLFDSRESALASNDRAKTWVRDRLADQLPEPADALAGEVIVSAPGVAPGGTAATGQSPMR